MEVSQRRARLVTRHHLDGTAADAVEAARDLVVLHATDPATVYLSVLARCADATLDSIRRQLYDDRALVRMMGMRRTLFVVPQELVPVVHHAASVDVAATMRRRLLTQLASLPTDPEVTGDLASWVEDVERGVERAIAARGSAVAAVLAEDEPRLRTAFLPTTQKGYDVRRTINSQVLTMMATQGRLVRTAPRGSWLSRQHTWEPADLWWPGGIAETPDARARLVTAYLARFGPATVTDVQWWTGWGLGVTRRALAEVETVDVDTGLVLESDVDPVPEPDPCAALLPALDATPMGWKERDWFLPEDPGLRGVLYDRNGNIGPTLWWGGEVVGGWSITPDGTVATRILVDRGDEAGRALAAAAQVLQARLGGAAVVPSFPTPLDKELRSGLSAG